MWRLQETHKKHICIIFSSISSKYTFTQDLSKNDIFKNALFRRISLSVMHLQTDNTAKLVWRDRIDISETSVKISTTKTIEITRI